MTGIGVVVGIGVESSFERYFVAHIHGLQLPYSFVKSAAAWAGIYSGTFAVAWHRKQLCRE